MLAWRERDPDGPTAIANWESRNLKGVRNTGSDHADSGD